jgi:hypothetical protein
VEAMITAALGGVQRVVVRRPWNTRDLMSNK